MKTQTILFDPKCGLCQSSKTWLMKLPRFIELRFLAADSDEARVRYPDLASSGRPEELIVVDDDGGVYREGKAWVMCLYALKEYRSWARRLSSPALFPLARNAFHFVSKNRYAVSFLLGLEKQGRLIPVLEKSAPVVCEPKGGVV